jgi:hypothetical protein
MRSTIAIFVITFAVLGLLLGFSESYDAPSSTALMKGTFQLEFRNNSASPCDDDSQGNKDDCFFIYQDLPDDGN